jgi:hypothetical protein
VNTIKVSRKELFNKKGKYDKGKRVLIYLLGGDAGISYTAIGRVPEEQSSGNKGMLGKVYKKVVERFKKISIKGMR